MMHIEEASQEIQEENANPIAREEIKSPLSPYKYRDEQEKALNDLHFGNIFNFGAWKSVLNKTYSTVAI